MGIRRLGEELQFSWDMEVVTDDLSLGWRHD